MGEVAYRASRDEIAEEEVEHGERLALGVGAVATIFGLEGFSFQREHALTPESYCIGHLGYENFTCWVGSQYHGPLDTCVYYSPQWHNSAAETVWTIRVGGKGGGGSSRGVAVQEAFQAVTVDVKAETAPRELVVPEAAAEVVRAEGPQACSAPGILIGAQDRCVTYPAYFGSQKIKYFSALSRNLPWSSSSDEQQRAPGANITLALLSPHQPRQGSDRPRRHRKAAGERGQGRGADGWDPRSCRNP